MDRRKDLKSRAGVEFALNLACGALLTLGSLRHLVAEADQSADGDDAAYCQQRRAEHVVMRKGDAASPANMLAIAAKVVDAFAFHFIGGMVQVPMGARHACQGLRISICDTIRLGQTAC